MQMVKTYVIRQALDKPKLNQKIMNTWNISLILLRSKEVYGEERDSENPLFFRCTQNNHYTLNQLQKFKESSKICLQMSIFHKISPMDL